MAAATINKLEDLLKDHIGPSKRIVDTKIEKLPPAGVGSIMLKFTSKLRSDDGAEEELHAVAKILPSSELARKLFDVQNTFKVEIAFYDTILPLLADFRRENGREPLECFPKFYGARINLDGSDVVDDDSALVLENLAVSGFRNDDRMKSFNMDTTKLVLRDLAKFHGTTIAFRLKHPDVFRSKILPLCVDLNSREPDKEDKIMEHMMKLSSAILSENDRCKHLRDLVKGETHFTKSNAREPFAAIAHCDLWVNNSMQKFVDGKAIENKLVDWQSYAYKSGVTDLIFLLFTSVQVPILERHLDFLLEYYHVCLLDTLQELNCDTAPFNYEKFVEDIRYENVVHKEYVHIIIFILIIRRNVHLSEKMLADMQSEQKANPQDVVKSLPKALKEALWLFVIEGEKRGWFKK